MAVLEMTIGQAARAAGVTRKPVRVYEAKGLLPEVARSTAGYRLYTPADVELLTFIRRARALGLHLDDVREVLEIRHGGTPPCDAVRDLLDARIEEVDTAVDDLIALRKTLVDTRRAADERACEPASPVCSIIEDA
ncbi:MerR family transcriptional regulator [Janibacter massiliensis]|uniref:MerR family transcriptional regulator n=1 Tax=Janibacter massiliensis TaxID=2058291 RepID=UPI000D0E518B|nr:MerR family transcriptional regulator [Janibacter massiliensis]